MATLDERQGPRSEKGEQSFWMRGHKLDPWPLDEGSKTKKVANGG